MSQSPVFDASLERLRAIGSVKWSQHPDAIGAFVAEMDFGTAPPIAAALHEAVDLGQLGYLPERLAARMSRRGPTSPATLRLGRAAPSGSGRSPTWCPAWSPRSSTSRGPGPR